MLLCFPYWLKKNMLDFVFAVDDPVTWHTMNLLQNRKHYSILKLLGPTKISSIQNDHGASVYYNTLVPVDGKVPTFTLKSPQSWFLSLYLFLAFLFVKCLFFVITSWRTFVTFSCSSQIIKYGVISTQSLIDDLLHWRTMYVAGRLHKPVSIMSICFGLIIRHTFHCQTYQTPPRFWLGVI